MNWKNWPYWLRGGVIGGGVALVFIIFWYSCAFYIDTIENSGKVSISFFCISIFFLTPASFPVAQLVNFFGQSFSVNSVVLSEWIFSYAQILNIFVWVLLGGFFGNIVWYFKIKEKEPAVKRAL